MHIILYFLSGLKFGMFHYKMLNLTVYAQVSFAKYKLAIGRSWIKKDLKSYPAVSRKNILCSIDKSRGKISPGP